MPASIKPNFLNGLKEMVAIPSISTDPEHGADMQKAAGWVAARLTALGMEKVAVMPTGDIRWWLENGCARRANRPC